MERIDKIKAIALDLDGTLVGESHHVSEKNKRAVKKAAQKGIKIILASGRPFAGIQKIAEEMELSRLGGYVVGANGGCVVDMKTGNRIGYKTIPTELYQEIDKLVKEWKNVEVLTYDEDSMLIENVNHPHAMSIARGLLIPIQKAENLIMQLKSPVNKFIITGEITDLTLIIAHLKEKFAGRLECIYGGGHFIEIMPYGVSKAEGLKLLMQKLHLSAENLMCIGDSANDIQMFEYAGFPVAMENACKEVKERACFVTGSCKENGVAKAIEYFIGKE